MSNTTINEAAIIHQGFELMLAREVDNIRKKQILQAQAFILNMHSVTEDIFEITKEALNEVISRCAEHKAKMSTMNIVGKESLNEFYTFKITQAQFLIQHLC